MAVAITSNKRPFRLDGVATEAYLVRMVFTAGTTSGTFVDADLTANNCHVIATPRTSTTTVDISDGSPGVTVTVNADDTVDLIVVSNPVIE